MIRLELKSPLSIYSLCILSSLLLTLSFPKFDFSFLVFFALLPLFLALSCGEFSILKILQVSLIFGTIHFSTLLYWIAYTLNRFGNIPWLGAIPILILLSLYLSLYLFLFVWLSLRIKAFFKPTFLKGLLVGSIFVSCEFLRSTLLTGLPWGLIGYPLASFTLLLQSADIYGIWGLSFLVVFINYYFFFTIKHLSDRTYKNTSFLVSQILFGMVITAVLSYGNHALSLWNHVLKQEKGSLRVTLLQGNIPQELKEAKENEVSLNTYEKLFWKAWEKKPQIVFLPETSFPFYFPNEPKPSMELLSFFDRVRRDALLNNNQFPVFVFGTFRVSFSASPPKIHNSLMVWHDSNLIDFYDKERLVPFGEYVPLVKYFPFLKRISVVSDILKPGEGKTLRVDLSNIVLEILPLICFESAFPQILVDRLKRGGDLVFIATNDAWFGKTSAPYQHFQIAIVRAVESRRYTLQAANTGITGIINPLGQVEIKSDLELEEVVHGYVKIYSQQTFFVKYGYIFPYVALFVSVLTFIYTLLKPARFVRALSYIDKH